MKTAQVIITVVACAWAARADVIAQSAAGVLEDLRGRHVTAVGGPTGFTQELAKAIDSRGPGDIDHRGVSYGTPSPDNTRVVKDGGPRYIEEAEAFIRWGPGFWDSSPSHAFVSPGPNPSSTLPESALAIAIVLDPQYYSVTFDPLFRPEIDYQLTIPAGASLVADSTDPLESSNALFSATSNTSLLSDPLWTLSWSADSAHPNSSIFQFTSNPMLGLNDTAIMSAFNALLSESGGTHTLTNTFSVSGALFPQLPTGTYSLDYSFGGSSTNRPARRLRRNRERLGCSEPG